MAARINFQWFGGELSPEERSVERRLVHRRLAAFVIVLLVDLVVPASVGGGNLVYLAWAEILALSGCLLPHHLFLWRLASKYQETKGSAAGQPANAPRKERWEKPPAERSRLHLCLLRHPIVLFGVVLVYPPPYHLSEVTARVVALFAVGLVLGAAAAAWFWWDDRPLGPELAARVNYSWFCGDLSPEERSIKRRLWIRTAGALLLILLVDLGLVHAVGTGGQGFWLTLQAMIWAELLALFGGLLRHDLPLWNRAYKYWQAKQ